MRQFNENNEKGPTSVGFMMSGNKVVVENYTLPSRFQIGDKVLLDFEESGTIKDCEVIKVHFSESKVLYDVEVSKLCTRLYNVDSCFVDIN